MADKPKSSRIDDSYIEELIADAQLYARYGRYSGSFRDARLFEAIANVLRERPLSERLVVELQRILNDTAHEIPYTTVVALKSGWTPGRQRPQTVVATLLLVLFSILLMVIVARLTLVHNRGTDLVITAEALIEDRPQQTVDRLIREHIFARQQFQSQLGEEGEVRDGIALTVLESNESELRRLSNRIFQATSDVGTYLSAESAFPFVGTREIYCAFGGRSDVCDPAPTAAPTGTGQLSSVCTLPEIDLAPDGTLEQWRQLTRDERRWLECEGILGYTPAKLAFFESRVEELRRRVGYYALWILPALYGAMGAVMYHMRWVLDPLLPHPSVLRLMHRIVLGALAGVILGWFYAPGSAIAEAATTVGFSLFVLAFFFGFSLDIFFAMLDRFVVYSERSIRGVLKQRDSEPDIGGFPRSIPRELAEEPGPHRPPGTPPEAPRPPQPDEKDQDTASFRSERGNGGGQSTSAVTSLPKKP